MGIFENKAKNLRDLLKSKDLIRIVGAHDGLTSKLIDKANFEGVWASGLEISASHGVPDANILTMSQFLERTIEMNEATNLPVIADCDTGYGNASNAIHMIDKYERAGIAGICIEDKKFPKINSFIEGKQELASIDEFSGKIKAIKQHQKNKETVCIARVEALIAGWGMEEALKRANAYADSGADLILIHSKKKEPDEIIEFCKKFNNRLPLVVVPTTYPNFNEKHMPELGIKIVIYANHILRTIISSTAVTLKDISDTNDLSRVDKKIAKLSEVFDLIGMKKLKENEKNYNSNDKSNIQCIIPAAGAPLFESSDGKNNKIPTSLLKIGEKKIIDRNIETLNSIGIQNLKIITGYKSNLFEKISATKINNNIFKKTTQLFSIIKGFEDTNSPILTLFSDIIFEADLIEKLINTKSDIVLAMDAVSPSATEFNDKIIAEFDPIRDFRTMMTNKKNFVKKIGKYINNKDANFEFTGLAFFSEKGVGVLKSSIRELSKKKKLEDIDFCEMMEFIINNTDQKVLGLEVNGGWLEIRSKSNFEYAKKIFL
jgi:phosphoenolpyruvate phosphomutase